MKWLIDLEISISRLEKYKKEDLSIDKLIISFTRYYCVSLLKKVLKNNNKWHNFDNSVSFLS